jgi:hypothetical protein
MRESELDSDWTEDNEFKADSKWTDNNWWFLDNMFEPMGPLRIQNSTHGL